MLTICCSQVSVIANTETKGGIVDETCPFMCLYHVFAKRTREYQATDRISATILTVRVELTTTSLG